MSRKLINLSFFIQSLLVQDSVVVIRNNNIKWTIGSLFPPLKDRSFKYTITVSIIWLWGFHTKSYSNVEEGLLPCQEKMRKESRKDAKRWVSCQEGKGSSYIITGKDFKVNKLRCGVFWLLKERWVVGCGSAWVYVLEAMTVQYSSSELWIQWTFLAPKVYLLSQKWPFSGLWLSPEILMSETLDFNYTSFTSSSPLKIPCPLARNTFIARLSQRDPLR